MAELDQLTTLRWARDADGIVTLTLDDPEASVNTMNQRYVADMAAVIDRLERERDAITGVVITSAKQTFFAGADLHELIQARKQDAARILAEVTRVKAQLRRLERLGKPVVAAINGAALGGGLEIALACHHRILLDKPGVEVGLPEVKLGLLPGGGGVTRTVRLLGLANALLNVLLQGQELRPAKALELGVVHELAGDQDELLAKARAWIAANPAPIQPWDVKGYKIPGGTPSTPSLAAMLPAFPANLRKQLKGAPYPAPHHILCAAVEGAQVDIDTALQIEGRYFVDLVTGQTAKNMTQAFFFDLQQVNGGVSRPDGHEPTRFEKAVVLGAGMMGAGIAYELARAGLPVVLKDVDTERAERGKAYSVGLLDKAVGRGRMSREKADAILARITPTGDVGEAAGADLVIEAVFEDPSLKQRVFAEVEQVVADGALLASNTSTLPISLLARGVQTPTDFVGLHFFSPVDKMPLVEIIRGEQTTDATLARSFDVVRLIKKTPILVNDSRGFFTSRVFGTFLLEGVALLAEGVDPSTVEQASAQAGYPAPVLQLVDELTLTLPRKIRDETRRALAESGAELPPHPSDVVFDRMVDEFGRTGRAGGAGFYDYADGKRARLWTGLREHFARGTQLPFLDMQERMLFAEALETIRCVDEGVIASSADANIGSIFGIGFPPWTGGVVQYIRGYAGGPAGFVDRARQLADTYGERFTPPESLVEAARAGRVPVG